MFGDHSNVSTEVPIGSAATTCFANVALAAPTSLLHSWPSSKVGRTPAQVALLIDRKLDATSTFAPGELIRFSFRTGSVCLCRSLNGGSARGAAPPSGITESWWTA